jgi:hypothetical protein
MEIWKEFADGGTTVEIAQKHRLSPKTIEWRRARIFRALGTNRIAVLTKKAIQAGVTTAACLVLLMGCAAPKPQAQSKTAAEPPRLIATDIPTPSTIWSQVASNLTLRISRGGVVIGEYPYAYGRVMLPGDYIVEWHY